MTPAGIEPATFRFVVQHLNHCATAVPIYSTYLCLYLSTMPDLYFQKPLLYCNGSDNRKLQDKLALYISLQNYPKGQTDQDNQRPEKMELYYMSLVSLSIAVILCSKVPKRQCQGCSGLFMHRHCLFYVKMDELMVDTDVIRVRVKMSNRFFCITLILF